MISKRSNIAVIGAGKIAYSLVHALVKKNYKVKLIISNNFNSAKHLAKKFHIKDYTNNLAQLDPQIKVLFISVPDNQIKITSNKLARLKINFCNSLFIHLSGAENISVLNSLHIKGALTASFHIMQAFPSKRIVKVENCYAAIETENKFAERFLFNIAENLKLRPFKLGTEEKSLYHLAGVFASNFIVGNIFNSKNIFDIRKSQNNYNNLDFLLPILKSTISNIKKLGNSKSLSGPIERGDLSTIKKHIKSLKKKSSATQMNYVYLNYIIQSLNLTDVVKSKYGRLSENHLEIKRFLLKEFRKALNRKIF